MERPLYLHQEKALLKADAGNNLIVTTGTGSGKTECFLLPILQSLLAEEQAGTLGIGVRAILIYPMNALANDQMKRMRQILKGHPQITFGIYTGNTEQTEENAKVAFHRSFGNDTEILGNEMLSRDRMRSTPPHILITNYSMLEYMMLRPKDDKVFSGAKLRYIVLDEAHVYKGTTGMETAMLMRRLRARITTRDTVQYILTSATLGDESADREITEFGYQLCGVNFQADNIIRSEDATPAMHAHNTYPPELFHELADTANSVKEVLEQFRITDPAPGADDNEKLYRSWKELFESNGFEGSGVHWDTGCVPMADCVIMPDARISDQNIGPYFVWETKKVMMDTKALALLGVTPELGAEVTLTYTLTDKNQLGRDVTDTFTLVGWWEYDELLAVHFFNVSEEYAKQIETMAVEEGMEPFRTDLSVMLPSSLNIEDTLTKIGQDCGYRVGEKVGQLRIGVNWGYTATQILDTLDTGGILAILPMLYLFDTPTPEAEAAAESYLSRLSDSATCPLAYESKATQRAHFREFQMTFAVLGGLLCAIIGIALLQILLIGLMESVGILALGKHFGFTEPRDWGQFWWLAISTFAVNFMLFFLWLFLSIRFDNQVPTLAAGMVGSLSGLFAAFMPSLVSYFLPWGYYIPLSTIRMDWNRETRIVRYYPAPYPVWLLALTAAFGVLFAAVAWEALKHKEV